MAISAGVVTGTATGLLIGRLSFATIFAAVDSRLSGFLISGISNVSPIILLCVTLFAFTGIVREAGVPDMMAKALEAGSAGRPSALRTELFLSAATLVVTTLFAAVTSASVALVGSLTDDIGRASNVHPYRRSHILSGLANSLPVLMPFSAFVLITMAAVSGLEGAAAVTPFTLMTAAFYPIALFLVMLMGLSLWAERAGRRNGRKCTCFRCGQHRLLSRRHDLQDSDGRRACHRTLHGRGGRALRCWLKADARISREGDRPLLPEAMTGGRALPQ